MSRHTPILLTDPGITYPTCDPAQPFTDYINATRAMIARTRPDITHYTADVAASNAPFELRPAKIRGGVLLVHGLLACPFIMRDLAQIFYAQGFLVRSILLPGHGTMPAALLNVNYTDWLQTIDNGVESLRRETSNIMLAGFSAGSLLAQLHAQHDNKIAAIVSIAPAFKIRSMLAGFAHWHQTVSRKYQRAAWFTIEKENDYTRYLSIPFNAIHMVNEAGRAYKKNRSVFQGPMFLVVSREDAVISTRTAIDNFMQNRNADSRAIYYSGGKKSFSDPRITTRHSRDKTKRIFNYSHLALPNAPDNPHYGMRGDYEFATRLRASEMYGESLLLRMRFNNFTFLRLTFNPDFAWMAKRLVEFLQRVF